MTMTITKPAVRPGVTVADVLERAADLLGEYGWCQGSYARTEAGQPLDFVTDSRARQFCLWGAVMRARKDLGRDAWATAFGRLPTESWNDEPGRTKQEVVQKLREAAERARATDG